MAYVGYHASITKSFYSSLAKEFKQTGANAYQIFLKTPKRKIMSKIKEDDALKCKEFISTNDIKLFVHSSYLFNTGAVPSEYSINTGVDDIQWIDKMGGLGAVFHMGKHCKRCSVEQCILQMKEYVSTVLAKTSGCDAHLILETGAGVGTEVCTSIDDLAKLYNMFTEEEKERISFCIDTCHIFAAGYDISTREGAHAYIKEFTEKLDWSKVILIHLNDSKVPCGSKKDRHENLGEGHINLEGLSYFVRYCQQSGITMVMETPTSKAKLVLKSSKEDPGFEYKTPVGKSRLEEVQLVRSWLQ